MRVFGDYLWKTCMNRGFYALRAERQAESGVWRGGIPIWNVQVEAEVEVSECEFAMGSVQV
jgi:hypothetical protein